MRLLLASKVHTRNIRARRAMIIVFAAFLDKRVITPCNYASGMISNSPLAHSDIYARGFLCKWWFSLAVAFKDLQRAHRLEMKKNRSFAVNLREYETRTRRRNRRSTAAVCPFFGKWVVFLPARSLAFNALRFSLVLSGEIIRPIRDRYMQGTQCAEVARTNREVP